MEEGRYLCLRWFCSLLPVRIYLIPTLACRFSDKGPLFWRLGSRGALHGHITKRLLRRLPLFSSYRLLCSLFSVVSPAHTRIRFRAIHTPLSVHLVSAHKTTSQVFQQLTRLEKHGLSRPLPAVWFRLGMHVAVVWKRRGEGGAWTVRIISLG